MEIINDIELKTNILNAYKKYIENYRVRYQATNPTYINKIQYFIDWLKNCSIDNLVVTKKEFFIKEISYNAYLEYVIGDYRYSQNNFKITAMFCSDKEITGYYNNLTFSNEANNELVPKEIQEGLERALQRKLLKDQGTGTISIARIINYNMGEPEKTSDLICELNYPYKIKKKVIQRKVTFVYNKENNRIIEHNNTRVDPSNNIDTEQKSTLPYQDYSKISYCYVATCVYGSYNCKQVYTLRRYRDYKLAKSIPGKIFIKTYYFIGSRAVKLFGKYKWFNRMFKPILDRMVIKLNKKGYLDTPYND